MRVLKVILLALTALGILACGSNMQWHVRDAAGQVAQVSDPYFGPQEKVVFRIGKIERDVEANQIEWLSINPGQLQTDAGRVYYGARLQLRDGSHFPDSSATDSLTGVMVCADGELIGDVHGNQVKIPLAQLREFSTLPYEHRQDSLAHPRDTTKVASKDTSSHEMLKNPTAPATEAPAVAPAASAPSPAPAPTK